MPLGFWLEHGRAIASLHPVRRVEATDKKPGLPALLSAGDGRRGWYAPEAYGGEPDDIPYPIWYTLAGYALEESWWKFYQTERAALDALSDALIRFARTPLEAPTTPTLTY